MKKLFYLVFALSLVSVLSVQKASAQSRGQFCATDEVRRELIGRNPFLLEAERVNEELIQNAILEMRNNRDEEPVLVIPVVFHIIHNYGVENIPDEQIHSAMEILNRDFRALNEDLSEVVPMFDTLIADPKIEFRLATKDFMGNCTNGIERIPSMATYTGSMAAKLNQWPRDRYLNIWVVNNITSNGPGQTLGYSQLPPNVVGDNNARLDGIVVLYNSLGVVGQGIPSRSRTLTHEVGHYLNLKHTWGDGNEPGITCDGTDAVDDTPVTKGHFGGCAQHLADFDCTAISLPTTPIYTFDDVTPSTGLVDPTPVYEAPNNDITLGSFTANGVSANPVTSGTFGYSNWGLGAADSLTDPAQLTGSINTSKYYEFTIYPTPGRAMTLSSITFNVRRSLNGPRSFAVRSSQNLFASNLSSTSTNSRVQVLAGNNFFFREDTTSTLLSGILINLAGSSFNRLTEPVTFRIYAWNSEEIDGVFEVDNVIITGSHGQIANSQNYMDYTDCTMMFTEGQKERMRAALSVNTAGRNNLWTQSNRILTGTWDDDVVVCPPKADFYAAQRFACPNTPVQFFDNSTNATVTSWYWTFQDGQPATSTEQNPVVMFTSGGDKTVTLTVTGAAGEDTKEIQNVVRISSTEPEFWDIPLSENFDDPWRFWALWVPINIDNTPSSFQRVDFVGYSNNTSVRLNAYDMAVTPISTGGGAIDELVSPSFSMQGLSNPSLSFRYAYATQSPDIENITDKLAVLYSTDCGATWIPLSTGTVNPGTANPIPISGGTISGLNLVSAGHYSTPFVPTSQNDWNYVHLNFPNVGSNARVRFKFVFTAGEFPNNLYIDDVNFNATVGVDELDSDFYGVNLFPNPSSTSTTLVYNNRTMAPVQISLVDLSGRVVKSWTPNISAPGQQTLDINTAELAKGVYMLNMKSESSTYTMRLLVQ
ncbi:MAG TPA: M43 family zinc metalloprotease [Flavobacteriales bacterium]